MKSSLPLQVWELIGCGERKDTCNRFTVHSYIHFLWMAGRSHLETLEMATPDQDTDQAPARLLLFVLRNSSLQRLDIRGSCFCARGWDKLAPGLVIGRATLSHPLLRAMLLAPGNFNTWTQAPTEWTYLLYHVLIGTLLGGEEGPQPI